MGKKSVPRRFSDNEAMASAKAIRVSPQKLNLLAGFVHGLVAVLAASPNLLAI